LVSCVDRILNAIELKDPIDRIPKMELFASILPTGKFLIKHHYYPRSWYDPLANVLTETVNTVREIMNMKDREPFNNYSLYGRTIRKIGLIEKITKKIFAEMNRKKSPAQIAKEDRDLVNIQAMAMGMAIKLGYDSFSLMLMQSPGLISRIGPSPDGHDYIILSDGAYYDINPDDLEVMPKGVNEPNINKKLQASTIHYKNIDIERWAGLVEHTMRKKVMGKRLRDQITCTLLTIGTFETWLTTFGNFNMHGFYRHVMKEHKNGSKGPYTDFLKVKTDVLCKLVKRLSEIEGYKVHIIGDDCSETNGPMLPPKIYRDFIAPHNKRVVDEAHKHGLKVIFHTDGRFKLDAASDPWEYMKILLDTGIDAFHPIEMLANDMEEMREQFADKLCLCNGMDTIELQNGTMKSVGQMTKNVLDKVYRGGGNRVNGYIAGSDNSLHGGVEYYLVRQMLYTIDEYSKKVL